MRYPDLTGKLMIHVHSGIRARVVARISKYYYSVQYIQKYNGKDVYTKGKAGVGYLFRRYLEIMEIKP